MTQAQEIQEIEKPKYLTLDGVTFVPGAVFREDAYRDANFDDSGKFYSGARVGFMFFDAPLEIWFARRADDDIERPLRSAAEARAYLCSKREKWSVPVASELLAKIERHKAKSET